MDPTPDPPGQKTVELPPAPESITIPVSNERFRDVAVRLTSEGYQVTGQARVFEATLGYSVEDGHNQLAEGFATATAGAPQWGNFSFAVSVKKARPNSTLHLILFESSPKDGSRTHELPVKLPD